MYWPCYVSCCAVMSYLFICWLLCFALYTMGLSLLYKVLAIILACLCHLCLLCSFALYVWVHHPCIWSLHSAIVLLCACLNLCLFKVVPVSSDHYKLFHGFAKCFSMILIYYHLPYILPFAIYWYAMFWNAMLCYAIILLFAISYVQEMASGFHISSTPLKVVFIFFTFQRWIDMFWFWFGVSINLFHYPVVCLPLRRSQGSQTHTLHWRPIRDPDYEGTTLRYLKDWDKPILLNPRHLICEKWFLCSFPSASWKLICCDLCQCASQS